MKKHNNIEHMKVQFFHLLKLIFKIKKEITIIKQFFH